MVYTRRTWANAPATTTPITATALNNIEDGVEVAYEAVTGRLAEANLDATIVSVGGESFALLNEDNEVSIGGVVVAAEQVGAAPPALEVFLPACDMYSTTLTPTMFQGIPMLLFPKRASVRDSFTRADGAIGSTDTGQTWTTANGGFTIAGNTAAPAVNAGARITVPWTLADSLTSIKVVALPGGTNDCSIVQRWVDASNYVFLTIRYNGILQVGHVIAGATTVLASSTATVSAGQVVTLVCSGATLTAEIAGTAVVTATTTVTSAGTAAGMRNGSDSTATFRADDFLISTDDFASIIAQVPADWPTYSISALFINTAAAGGNAHWAVSARDIDLAGSTLGVVPVGYQTLLAPVTVGPRQEAYMAADLAVPATGPIAFTVTRAGSAADDTLASTLGLIGLYLRAGAE